MNYHQQSHSQSPSSSAPSARLPSPPPSTGSPSVPHSPSTPPVSPPTSTQSASATTTSTIDISTSAAGSAIPQNGGPSTSSTNPGGEVASTVVSLSQPPLHQMSSSSPPITTAQQCTHPASSGEEVTTSSSSQPPQTSISTSTATTIPQSSHVGQSTSTCTTDQRQSQSGVLASQITAMAISPPPQLPPNSSPLPTTSSSVSPSSYTAHPGTTGIVQHHQHQQQQQQHRHDYTPSASGFSQQQQQQQHGYPSSTGEVTTMANSSLPPSVVDQYQHSYVGSSSGSPSASSALQQQHGYPSPSPSPSLPPPSPPSATGRVATTMSGDSGSSHPPSITAQQISSQQSHAASPDASYGHHHGHHRPPPHPSHAPPPSNTGQMRPNFPPQAVPPNFAHFGPPHHHAPQANPGTTAMKFHPHSHQAPPLATGNQFTTAIPSHVPLSTFQHPTTASPYAAPPRGSAEQRHAMPIGYFPPHPYVPSQHAVNPPPMQQQQQQQQQPSVGYPSPSSNFSSRAVHGSVASSCGSSYLSPAGSSPYPPYRPAAVYNQQQPQPMLSTASVTQRPINSGRIFILYCKDQQLHRTFSDDILDLADTLNHCGGFTCTVDHYVDAPPPNWNIWTQLLIEESQYVILVCSPTLSQVLREPGNYILEMEKGKYYASTIVNYIQPHKVIPVYLNSYVPRGFLDWVPTQLHTSTVYSLNVAELRSALVVSEDSPRHVLDERLRLALSEERFRNIAKLVNHLRGETATSPPVPPERPIPIPPSIGLGAPSHQFSPNYPPTFPSSRQGLHEHIPSSSFEKIAERMPRDWFTLGVKLGVESTQLQKLRTKHSFEHIPAALEMFSLWQQTKGRLATRKALKDALVKMEYGRLAYELFPDVKI